MAERRMFSKTIIDSDMFLDMPLSTQALYFHLSMRADDDGFINNPRKIQRMIGSSEDDLRLLQAKQFIIPFDSGIVVIKHWRIHNYIQKDRYKETLYKDEKACLSEKNGVYTQCIQDVSNMDTQDRLEIELDKDSIVKDSIGEDITGSLEPVTAPELPEPVKPEKKKKAEKAEKVERHKYGEYNNVLLSDEEIEKLQTEFPDLQQRIERLSEYMASTGKSYKSHYATIKAWARKDSNTSQSYQYQPQRKQTALEAAREELGRIFEMTKEQETQNDDTERNDTDIWNYGTGFPDL